MKKRGLSFFLSAIAFSAFALTACSGSEGGKTVKLKETDVDVWTVAATEKILQDKPNLYEEMKMEKSISLYMAQNEYESSQIILSPSKDVPYYNVTVSDLVMAGTEYKIESEEIALYNEKYIRVAVNYENNGAPTGMYPDALLPFETAKKYGENVVKKEQNQGIYVTVKTAPDQEPGVYSGNITVDFKDFVETVPVTVKVADIAVSEERHAKNIFLTEWSYQNGELESGQEKLDDYTEMLFRYRLSPNRIVSDISLYSDEQVAYYVDKAYEYMQDVRCTNITVPYLSSSYQGQTCFEVSLFEKVLRAFAEKSFETGYNMYDKLVCYFSMLDEPTVAVLKRIEVACTAYKETLEKVASSYENDDTVTAENKAEVIEGIRNLRNVVTSSYKNEFAPYIDTWCPTVNGYDTEKARKYYETQEEKWWYTCILPRAPYPTYHIEDTLLSARALSWMQAEYNVVGNLYWAVNIYGSWDDGAYQPIDDYYNTSATRYPQVNGDGFLFYPGGQYGLDMPVASLRLEAIRDGLEEYELLYALKQKYQALSEECGYDFNADNVLSLLGQFLYKGTQVATDSESLLAAREQLFVLSDCVQSAAGMCVIDSSDDGYGNVTMKVFAKEGYALKESGAEIAAANVETVEGGKIYTVKKSLSNAKNEFAFSFEANGKTYSYVKYAGGKVSSVSADELANSVESEDVTPKTSIVSGSTVDPAIEKNLLKIELPLSVETMQSVRLTSALIQGANASSEKLVLHIYSDSVAQISLTVSACYTKKALYFDLVNATLVKGMNEVEIPLGNTDWNTVGEIEALILYFGTDYNQPARTVYVQDVILYDK